MEKDRPQQPFTVHMDISIHEVKLLYQCINSYAETSSELHPSEKERLTKLRNLFYRVIMENQFLNN